jgi:hypothetical protein
MGFDAPRVARDSGASHILERCPAKPVCPVVVVADAQAIEAPLALDVPPKRYEGFQDFLATAKTSA